VAAVDIHLQPVLSRGVLMLVLGRTIMILGRTQCSILEVGKLIEVVTCMGPLTLVIQRCAHRSTLSSACY